MCARVYACARHVGCTFDPLAKLVQVMHWTGLAQLDLSFGALQCRSCAECLLHSQHHLIHLKRQPPHNHTTIQYLQHINFVKYNTISIHQFMQILCIQNVIEIDIWDN